MSEISSFVIDITDDDISINDVVDCNDECCYCIDESDCNDGY